MGKQERAGFREKGIGLKYVYIMCERYGQCRIHVLLQNRSHGHCKRVDCIACDIRLDALACATLWYKVPSPQYAVQVCQPFPLRLEAPPAA